MIDFVTCICYNIYRKLRESRGTIALNTMCGWEESAFFYSGTNLLTLQF